MNANLIAHFAKSAALAASLLMAGAAIPAGAKTIELWHRPGGYTHQHILQANRWLATRTKVVIRDWQVSAAAIQVVYFKRKGGNVCFAKSAFNAQPALHFHLSETRGKFHNPLAQYIGKTNTAKIGKLSAYSFKKFHPSAFGIKACAGSIKADVKTRSRPGLMRW